MAFHCLELSYPDTRVGHREGFRLHRRRWYVGTFCQSYILFTGLATGGTAGCVLASRLSENPDTTVLLLERGPVVDSWVSKVPLISIDFRSARSPSYKWTSAASALATAASSPPLSMVSGKALGGTSKINMHVYDRPLPAEFNNWTRQGRVGWSWEEVLPYFKRSEGSLTYKSSPHRGTEGIPSDVPLVSLDELTHAFRSLEDPPPG